MTEATSTFNPQSASLLLSILQSKAGGRWDRALQELEAKRLQVEGDFPQFVVTNKSGIRYSVTLDAQGNGTCTCPDFQIRTSQEGRLCKHVAAAAISSLIPLIPSPQAAPIRSGQASAVSAQTPQSGSQASPNGKPLVFRFRTSVRGEGKDGLQVEVGGTLTGDESEDWQTVLSAYRSIGRVAGWLAARTESSAGRSRRGSQETAKTVPAKPPASAVGNQPIPAVISKIDRMKTRRGESFFLAVEAGADTVRVFGTPEELAERLEESGYDIPAGEIQAGMELHLPCLVVLGVGANGYKTIEKFLPESA